MASTHKSLPISHAFSAKSCLLVFLCVSTPRTSQTRPSGRYKCLAKSFSRPKKPRPPRPAAPSASSQATRPPAAPRVDPSRPRHRLSDGSHVLVGKVVPVGVLAARARRVLGNRDRRVALVGRVHRADALRQVLQIPRVLAQEACRPPALTPPRTPFARPRGGSGTRGGRRRHQR